MITNQDIITLLTESTQNMEDIKSLICYNNEQELCLIRITQLQNTLKLLQAHLSRFAICDICEKEFKSTDLIFDLNSPDIMCKNCYIEIDNSCIDKF